MNTFLLIAALVATANGLYDASDDVVELTQSNFNKLVIGSSELWLVEFYAPWCGHCKSLAPEWKKAASALKPFVKVGAVDADTHGSVASPYGVRGFPTIKIFGSNKNNPTDYRGGRTAKDIVDEATRQMTAMIKERLSGKGGSGGQRKSSGGGSGGSDGKDVVELTDSNFEEKVLKSKDMWLVEFFAPWCGHCKRLEPEWANAASQLKGKVKLGALDSTVHTVMSGRYGIQGFPTIKFFFNGEESEYDGGRTASDIVAWALDKHGENIEAPEVHQLTEESVLKAACDDHQLCVVAVLPHIFDCQSKCRNEYITLLKNAGDRFKKQRWGWVWAEAGQHMAMESAFDIGGFGYPALAVANSRKMKFALMRGSFSENGINEFLRDLSYGKGRTAPLKKMPEIKKVDAWDGKDGVMEVEEDIDLSDVDLDDLSDVKEEL